MTTTFAIIQGKTFAPVVRFGTKPYLYKAVTAISKSAPAHLTVPSHGLPDGWPAAVVSAQGMTQINAAGEPPDLDEKDYRPATKIDVNSIDFNEINSSEFSAYTGGGYLQCLTPVDLAGCVSRLTIKDAPGGAILKALTSAAAEIVLDNTAKTITATFTAAVTAGFAWASGYFEWELETAAGVVYRLLAGPVSVETEIVT